MRITARVAGFLVLAGCADESGQVTGITRERHVDLAAVADQLNAVADRIALSLADETAVAALRLAGGTTASAAIHAESDPPEVMCINTLGEPSVIFQQSQLGRTYEWDATAGVYVAGSAMTAPECAIRITIYAIDPATEEPVVPPEPLGYVEVTDLGSSNLAGGHWRLRIERVVALPGGALERTASYVISRGISFFQGGSNTTTRGFEGSFRADPELSVTHSYSFTQHRMLPSTLQDRLSFAFEDDSLVVQRDQAGGSGVHAVRVRTDTGTVEIDVFGGVIEWRDPSGAVDTVALCTCSTEPLTFTDRVGASLDPAVEAGLRDFWGALQDRFGLGPWPQFTAGGFLTP